MSGCCYIPVISAVKLFYEVFSTNVFDGQVIVIIPSSKSAMQTVSCSRLVKL